MSCVERAFPYSFLHTQDSLTPYSIANWTVLCFGRSRFVCSLNPWRSDVYPLEYRSALYITGNCSRFLGNNCDAIGEEKETNEYCGRILTRRNAVHVLTAHQYHLVACGLPSEWQGHRSIKQISNFKKYIFFLAQTQAPRISLHRSLFFLIFFFSFFGSS